MVLGLTIVMVCFLQFLLAQDRAKFDGAAGRSSELRWVSLVVPLRRESALLRQDEKIEGTGHEQEVSSQCPLSVRVGQEVQAVLWKQQAGVTAPATAVSKPGLRP